MRYRLVIIDANGKRITLERVGLRAITDVKKLIQDDTVQFPKWALYEVQQRRATIDNPCLEVVRRIDASDTWLN